MNWRERITSLKEGATVFLRATTSLLLDISQRELGTKQALIDMGRAFEELYQKTGEDYAFDEKVVRTYADNLLELYALHHLIHIMGMSSFHEHIMDLEISRRFGPRYGSPPTRIDKRDLVTLAKLIRQNEEVSHGRHREEEPSRRRGSDRGKEPEPEE